MTQKKKTPGGARPEEQMERQPQQRRQPPPKQTQAKPAQAGQARQAAAPKKKGPPKYTGKALILRRAYLALTVLSAIIVVAYIAFNLFSAPPDPTPSSVNGPGASRKPITTHMIDEYGNMVEVEIAPGLSADRKKEFYTFLVVGLSQETGGGLSDTMLLAAYDVPNQTLNIMSLPRDIYVEYGGRRCLLNAVYTTGGGSKDNKGVEALKEEVGELTGVVPDYFVVAHWEAVGELVDAIDGVDYEVPRRMFYWDRSQNFRIDLQAGYQHLNGDQAMQLIRWRQNTDAVGNVLNVGYPDGDLGRIKTQQSFLKAVIKKCLQPEVLLSNLTGYIDVFQRNVTTDLGASELTYFVKSAVGGLDMDSVGFYTLPWVEAGNGHLLAVPNKVLTTVNEAFNPYLEDIQRHELNIVTTGPAISSPKPSSSQPPESEAPVETAEPNATDSPRPTESAEPSGQPGEGDPLLPPGVTADPRPSRGPGEGTASPEPSGGTESPDPTETGEAPGPSPSGGEEPLPPPAGTQEPTPAPTLEPPPAPTLEPPPAPTPEEPLLPPGV